MELLFVATDNGLSVFNPSNKQETLKEWATLIFYNDIKLNIMVLTMS